MNDAVSTFYEEVGGAPTFRALVAGFYRRVATDPLLRPMYPEEDLGPAEERLRMFLEQYWGGPKTYHERRGHPRLRMRHVPFRVTPRARDAWLSHMRASMDEVGLDEAHDRQLWEYLQGAAQMMVNADDDAPDAGPPYTLMPNAGMRLDITQRDSS